MIDRQLRRLRLGSPLGNGLCVIPLFIESDDTQPLELDYDVLKSQTLDRVRVTEISKSGNVPQLRVTNRLAVHLFLLDGQELIGAKQNRILNVDVLVSPESELIVPVSCVEAGRWSSVSPSFVPGKSAPALMRQRKVERVQSALRSRRGYDAGQVEVWREVDEMAAMHCVASPTSALSDVYASVNAKLAEHRGTLQPPADAVGMAIFDRGKFRGLDVFDRPETLLHFWESLIDSYLLEHVAATRRPAEAGASDVPRRTDKAVENEARALIDGAASAEWESFPSPGEGCDMRILHKSLVGSCLSWPGSSADDAQDRLVHLQLFPRERSALKAYRPRVRRRFRNEDLPE